MPGCCCQCRAKLALPADLFVLVAVFGRCWRCRWTVPLMPSALGNVGSVDGCFRRCRKRLVSLAATKAVLARGGLCQRWTFPEVDFASGGLWFSRAIGNLGSLAPHCRTLRGIALPGLTRASHPAAGWWHAQSGRTAAPVSWGAGRRGSCPRWSRRKRCSELLLLQLLRGQLLLLLEGGALGEGGQLPLLLGSSLEEQLPSPESEEG